METTVTMSLERYKTLEACEKSINELKSGRDFLLTIIDYTEYRVFEKQKAIQEMVERYTILYSRIDRIRTKVNEKDQPKMYEFLKNELYY